MVNKHTLVRRLQLRVEEFRERDWKFPEGPRIFPGLPRWKYDKFTCWGPVRGCCGIIHRTEAAAKRCVRKDMEEQVDKGLDSDRQVRGIADKHQIEKYDPIVGPGEPIFMHARKREEERLRTRLVSHIRFNLAGHDNTFVEVVFKASIGFLYSVWGQDEQGQYKTENRGPFETRKDCELAAIKYIAHQGGEPISRHHHWEPIDIHNSGIAPK